MLPGFWVSQEPRGAAAEERVQHLPGTAKEQQETGVGDELFPEVEEQDGARLFPSPGPLSAHPRPHQGVRCRAARPRHGNLHLTDVTAGVQPLGREHLHMEIEEIVILEVAAHIRVMGPDKVPADVQPRTLHEGSDERCTGAVMSCDDAARRIKAVHRGKDCFRRQRRGGHTVLSSHEEPPTSSRTEPGLRALSGLHT